MDDFGTGVCCCQTDYGQIQQLQDFRICLPAHVGHPLGYIASDIYSRYKRLQGFNVLHPMGYDSYGLPAEQYAIQTGQHPEVTTKKNIARYREQMDKIGFSYDWSREVRTCDPGYYKWTQWAFIQMFNSYYCYDAKQARPISELIDVFAAQGTKDLNIACSEELSFTAAEWNAMSLRKLGKFNHKGRNAYANSRLHPKNGVPLQFRNTISDTDHSDTQLESA